MPESVLICPECETENDPQAAVCVQCGHHFDVIGGIMNRERQRFADRFTERAGSSLEIKAAEQEASQQRTQQFLEDDLRRQAALMTQLQERRRQEQQLYRLAIALLVVAILAMIVIALLAVRA
jgi:hypothetical protein